MGNGTSALIHTCVKLTTEDMSMIVLFMLGALMMVPLFIILLTYFDDMLITTDYLYEVNELNIILREELDMKYINST